MRNQLCDRVYGKAWLPLDAEELVWTETVNKATLEATSTATSYTNVSLDEELIHLENDVDCQTLGMCRETQLGD